MTLTADAESSSRKSGRCQSRSPVSPNTARQYSSTGKSGMRNCPSVAGLVRTTCGEPEYLRSRSTGNAATQYALAGWPSGPTSLPESSDRFRDSVSLTLVMSRLERSIWIGVARSPRPSVTADFSHHLSSPGTCAVKRYVPGPMPAISNLSATDCEEIGSARSSNRTRLTVVRSVGVVGSTIASVFTRPDKVTVGCSVRATSASVSRATPAPPARRRRRALMRAGSVR